MAFQVFFNFGAQFSCSRFLCSFGMLKLTVHSQQGVDRLSVFRAITVYIRKRDDRCCGRLGQWSLEPFSWVFLEEVYTIVFTAILALRFGDQLISFRIALIRLNIV